MLDATRVIILTAAVCVAWPASAGPADREAPRRTATAVRQLGEAYRAHAASDFARAYTIAAAIDRDRLQNGDYALYVLAQSASLLGKHAEALRHFQALARRSGSRFRGVARWRVADSLWELGRHAEAQRAYRKLVAVAAKQRRPEGDVGLARFRIAEAHAPVDRSGRPRRIAPKARKAAIRGLRAFVREHPAHPLAARAEERLLALGGARAAELDASERVARAERLTAAHRWHESIAELATIGDDEGADVLRERDYWTGMTLFKMRRRYEDAGRILLRIYQDMGSLAARTLFHGARALSRADLDPEAVRWYQRVVAEYPRSSWAEEAQFLSGWLEFNMGNYRAAIPHLERMLDRYGRSRWADEASWFLGFCHFLLGDHQRALPHFATLAKDGDKLVGGKGAYWHARSLHQLGRQDEAIAGYRALVGRFPFSWYAQLARSRLAGLGVAIGPFGDEPRDPEGAPPLADAVDPDVARDPLIRAVDELIAAGLDVEAGHELRRGERAFLKRHKRPAALAVALDRYRRAGNFNRPWMIAVVFGGRRALDAPPKGRARAWWEHAYPQAYRDLVEKWRSLGDSPPYYLYAIMRKESGFNPHTVSYADAIGLLQMIPPTTRRVVRHLGLTYTRDLLYDPELNIRAGAWYIGRLLAKFKRQIPYGAGSFNSGPRPVMRWLDEWGDRPADEFVELVPYRQTRGYMKKVTETYARYLYLYTGEVYEQPLEVDRQYVANELTY